jgi:D-alanine-D-alanine ligase
MGSSVGVSKAHDARELQDAAALASTYDEWIIFEEAVTAREIEVSVIGNRTPRASLAGEITPGNDFYDYEDKYVTDSATLMVPAGLTAAESDEVRGLALRAYQTLHCEGMARVDFFFEENGRGFLCNEINTIPGFTPISMYPKLWAASGLSYGDLIDELVDHALERHSRRKRNTGR